MKKTALTLLASSVIAGSAFGSIALDFSNVTSVDNYLVVGEVTTNSATSGTDILRFNNVATGYDLLITTTSDYLAANASKNGLATGDVFGQINMFTNTSASFQFKIVDAGTSDLATVDNIAFSFLDIDSENASSAPYESISVTQPGDLFRDVNTTLGLTSGGGLATLANNTVGEIANPTSTTLSAAQSAIAATFIFENTNVFDFTFSTGANVYGGRNVLFGGTVNFDEIDEGIAVPEPSSYSLLLGLAAFGFLAMRRKSA